MSQDLLESGVARPPGRRRRLAAGLGAVVLAGSGFWLAARSNPSPPPAAPLAAPVVETPPPASTSAVLGLAVGDTEAYALVGTCLVTPPEKCGQQLLVRTRGANWTSAAQLPPPASGSLSTRLLPGSPPVVVDDLASVGYAVAGSRVTRLRLRSGPPVQALPPGSVLERENDLRALDPGTGVRRRLAHQPPGEPIDAVARSGCRFVTVGIPGSAISTDCGATWTAVPVPVRLGYRWVQVVVAPSGEAYLLVSRDTDVSVANEFSELWRYAGGRWTNVTPGARPRSAQSMVLHEGRLLFAEETGGAWRLEPDGTLARMPEAAVDGTPVGPAYLVSGPAGLLLGQAPDVLGRPVLLTSADGGRSWESFVVG